MEDKCQKKEEKSLPSESDAAGTGSVDGDVKSDNDSDAETVSPCLKPPVNVRAISSYLFAY